MLQGSPAVRRDAATQFRAAKFNVVLTTYEYVMKDKAILSKVSFSPMIHLFTRFTYQLFTRVLLSCSIMSDHAKTGAWLHERFQPGLREMLTGTERDCSRDWERLQPGLRDCSRDWERLQPGLREIAAGTERDFSRTERDFSRDWERLQPDWERDFNQGWERFQLELREISAGTERDFTWGKRADISAPLYSTACKLMTASLGPTQAVNPALLEQIEAKSEVNPFVFHLKIPCNSNWFSASQSPQSS